MELEDEAQLRQAQRREFGGIGLRRVAAFQDDRSRSRPVEQPEQLEQRGLARSRRPGDRDELALPDAEVDALYSVTGTGRAAPALCPAPRPPPPSCRPPDDIDRVRPAARRAGMTAASGRSYQRERPEGP